MNRTSLAPTVSVRTSTFLADPVYTQKRVAPRWPLMSAPPVSATGVAGAAMVGPGIPPATPCACATAAPSRAPQCLR
jgi:hypothetical protein